MFENGKPFIKIWNVLDLKKCTGSDFDSCMGMFVEFVKNCSKRAAGKAYSNSILYDVWRRISLCNGSWMFCIDANRIGGFFKRNLGESFVVGM